MATEHGNHHDHLENVEVSYERRDLGARGILLFFAILLVAGVIVHFLVWGVYGAMEKVVAHMDPPPNPVRPAEPPPKAVMLQNTPMVDLNKFAQPRLQSDDTQDMTTFLWQEDQILKTNAWTDDKGVVHLPIDVAKEQLLKRGLPSRSGGAAPTATPTQTSMGNPAENAKQATSNSSAPRQ